MTTPGRLLHLSTQLKHVGSGCTAVYKLTKGTTCTVLVLGVTEGRRPDDCEIHDMLAGAPAAVRTALEDYLESMKPQEKS